ncbi:MAG TPA: glycosyltransferase family 4 protein [Phycisphaerae bacterium]|nr:glycosyltransferase family 4 protein [Phycisphaerae bacterium]
MRILHFVNAYFPSTGGTVTRIHNLFRGDSHEHTFVIPVSEKTVQTSGRDAFPPSEDIDNLRIRRVIVPAASGLRRFSPSYYRSQAQRLVEAAGVERPDLLYGHNPLTCAIASRHYHGSRPDVPFIYEAHGIMRDFSNVGPGHPLSAIRDHLTRRILGAVERGVFARVDVAIAQTHAAKQRIAELYGLSDDRIAVIHNGVDLDRFSADFWRHKRAEIRQARSWKERRVVFYAGYLDEVNGTAALLNIAAAAPTDADRQLKFVFAGKGPRENDVRRAAAVHPDRIEFLGAVPHDEMPGYYAAIDVFVIPRPPFRPAETLLPMKLLEAMAMEKLVIVSSVAGMTDVVRDGDNGLVFPKERPSALRDALLRIGSAPSVLSLGKRARETVLARFSWPESRSQLDALYTRMMTSR